MYPISITTYLFIVCSSITATHSLQLASASQFTSFRHAHMNHLHFDHQLVPLDMDPSLPLLDGLRVMITGGNGVLGQALIQHAIHTKTTSTIFATYRTPSKCNIIYDDNPPTVIPLMLDLNDETNHNMLSNFFVNYPEVISSDKPFALFNNAGVCIPGNTLSALQTSLLVNCWAPALLSNALFRCPSAGNRRTVINVSSGEGELVLLHSDIQTKLQQIDNYEVGILSFAYLNTYLHHSYPNQHD